MPKIANKKEDKILVNSRAVHKWRQHLGLVWIFCYVKIAIRCIPYQILNLRPGSTKYTMVTEKQEVGKVAKEESAGSDTDKSDSAGEATDAEVFVDSGRKS